MCGVGRSYLFSAPPQMFGPFGHWQGLATEMMIHPQRETNYWHEEIFLCAKASDPILNHASCARPSASKQLQSAKGRDFCKKLEYSRTREGTALRSRKFENVSESEGGGEGLYLGVSARAPFAATGTCQLCKALRLTRV